VPLEELQIFCRKFALRKPGPNNAEECLEAMQSLADGLLEICVMGLQDYGASPAHSQQHTCISRRERTLQAIQKL
jgi:hypothetical protein